MLIKKLCACANCGQITMLNCITSGKAFDIVYTCPDCRSEIRGHYSDNDFSFDGAAILPKSAAADHFLQVSRDLPGSHVSSFSEAQTASLDSFVLYSKYVLPLQNTSRYRKALRFLDEGSRQTDLMFHYLALMHRGDRSDLRSALMFHHLALMHRGDRSDLRSALFFELPRQRFSMSNDCELYYALDTVIRSYLDDLVPMSYSDSSVLKTVMEISESCAEPFEKFVREYENTNRFIEIDIKLCEAMRRIILCADKLLPAFLLLDYPELAKNAEQFALTTITLDELTDLYLSSYNAVTEGFDILMALNNIKYRADHTKYPDLVSVTEHKSDTLIDPAEFFSALVTALSREWVREAILYGKCAYDGITQTLTYTYEQQQEKINLIELALLCIENLTLCTSLSFIIHAVEQSCPIALGRTYEDIDDVPQMNVAPNAACPCGSGKKYKHCCGKPE